MTVARTFYKLFYLGLILKVGSLAISMTQQLGYSIGSNYPSSLYNPIEIIVFRLISSAGLIGEFLFWLGLLFIGPRIFLHYVPEAK